MSVERLIGDRLQARLRRCCERFSPPEMTVIGRLVKTVGMTLDATGLQHLPVGSRCCIYDRSGADVQVEIVGFTGEISHLMPLGPMHEVLPNARVFPLPHKALFTISDAVIGRVLNGKGEPLDGKGPIPGDRTISIHNPAPINPLSRAGITQALDVGIRAINALTTVGCGQRVGLFAGSGVGKSVLLGMMSTFTAADVAVVGLIGERGREVKEFVERTLGPEGLKKTIVVASPADDPPLLRVQAALLSASIAEYFRDQGKQVLLLMDSLTRFAQAHREIAIATGEPPATKGYSPSVFYKLTQLVERAGCSAVSGGAVTAFYTVLTEGDDLQDPVADAARAILDGHIVLSRRLAEQGLYPAIDIEASISRAMTQIVDAAWVEKARALKKLYAYYRSNQDMITVGAYRRGSDRELDQAIVMYPRIFSFIQQQTHTAVSLANSRAQLDQLMGQLENAPLAVKPSGGVMPQ